MKINVKELQSNYIRLHDIVEDYINIFNNYYNEINFIPKYWKSPKANYFMFITEEEKKNNKEFYHELELFSFLYKYIIGKYSEFKGKLEVNDDGEDLIVNKIIDNNIDDLISKYDAIKSKSPIIEEKINNQKEIIKNNKKDLLNYKDEVKGLYDKINNVELDIKHKISGILIKGVTETISENKSLGELEKLEYDLKSIEISYNKMKLYRNEFNDNSEELNDIIKELNENYNTSNISELKELQDRIIMKYTIIKKNINNNLNLLNQNIEILKESSNIMKRVSMEVESTFNE